MELLIGLVVIAVLGLMAFGLFGMTFMGWSAKKDAQALDQEPQILDALFNGDRHVSYRAGAVGSLPFEKVVVGGIERGYTLTHDSTSGGTQVLIFELTEPDLVPDQAPNAIPSRPQSAARSDDALYGTFSLVAGGVLLVGGVLLAVNSPELIGLALVLAALGVALGVYGVRLRRTLSS